MQRLQAPGENRDRKSRHLWFCASERRDKRKDISTVKKYAEYQAENYQAVVKVCT